MNEQEYAKIISKNLKRLAYEHGKQQIDIARDLGINRATLSAWMNGTRTPKVSKIDMFCEYFGVLRSDITEPYDPNRKRDFPLTISEIELIKAYRSAPDGIQSSIRKLLDIQEKGNEGQALESHSA